MTRTDHQPFTITCAVDGDAAVLSPSGEVDLHGAPILLDAGDAALQSGHRHLTIDCSHAWFLDSAGLRSVMLLQRRAEALGGGLRITNPSKIVSAVLKVSGLEDLIA
jgi:anti-anti-sigma factor